MGNQLSQAALRLDLAWTQGDPVSLSFRWPDEDVSGSYTAPVRDKERGGTLLKNLGVTATYFPPSGGAAGYTLIMLTMSQVDSAAVPAGDWYWSMTRVGGATLLAGRVNVADGRQA
jgi:hypothetical protein